MDKKKGVGIVAAVIILSLIIVYWYIFVTIGLIYLGYWLQKNKLHNGNAKKITMWFSISLLSISALYIGIGHKTVSNDANNSQNTAQVTPKQSKNNENIITAAMPITVKDETKVNEKQKKEQINKSSSLERSDSKSDNKTVEDQQSAAISNETVQTYPSENANTVSTNQQSIVGNSKSKIYHVPGQSEYKISPDNIVYFNSEQDAINQGYSKSKR